MSKRTERLEIRLTPLERQWLEALARADDRSLSSTMRELLRHAIQGTIYRKRMTEDGSLTIKSQVND